ncbi:LysR family transcriptional regulator [Paenibacillus sp. OAS669]|uniref:LysR family transcriptional regulator n=1 Tax=Paenibacillus sp. OAS669 TaxID=2663821 RepID=UPI00178BB790|nr:LysR family transcriptional regulator [Paenibacillus sp. OAS669]MBE1444099.1 DNA-binding transcriptional LysR family regulator [Paenibacillus sp. OAS669]
MDINDLKIFQTVAEQGSVSKAAKELSYVQSNVTARIQQLEHELGTTLFSRHRKGVALNADGRKLLEYTQKILKLMDDMKQAFHDQEDPSGPLLIGTVETVSSLPALLSAYCKQYPRVDLSLVTGVTEHLMNEVLQYQLDGAFVTGPIQHAEMEQDYLIEEDLVLIAKKDEAFSSLEHCLDKPLLVFRAGCGYRARLVQWLGQQGVAPAKIMEFGTLETILAMVSSGLGISLVPKSTIRHLEADGGLRCFTLPEQFSRITTVFIRRRDSLLGATMQKFLDNVSEFHRMNKAAAAAVQGAEEHLDASSRLSAG